MITEDSSIRLKIIKAENGYVVDHYSKTSSDHLCYTKILPNFKELIYYLSVEFREKSSYDLGLRLDG